MDDEVPILKMLTRAFTRACYGVETAESAEEAMELKKLLEAAEQAFQKLARWKREEKIFNLEMSLLTKDKTEREMI